jgi:hypothetical protein
MGGHESRKYRKIGAAETWQSEHALLRAKIVMIKV